MFTVGFPCVNSPTFALKDKNLNVRIFPCIIMYQIKFEGFRGGETQVKLGLLWNRVDSPYFGHDLTPDFVLTSALIIYMTNSTTWYTAALQKTILDCKPFQ